VSDEEIKAVTLVPVADYTMKDLEQIQKFKDDGLLGLHAITDVDCERSMALYMDGKTYRQIASILKINKTVILFLSHKFKWFEMRRDYLDELHATMKDKITESKLQSQEFLLNLVSAYQKKISRNINNYLRTDNEEFTDRIDNKDIGTVLKIMELLHKLDHETMGMPGDKSLVGLNGLGEGVTITKTGSNSVEITPKSPFSSKLKEFAELKRAQEKETLDSLKKSHDIGVDNASNEKESES